MSMQDLLDGISVVKNNPSRAFFAGERSESLVRAAESLLSVVFPPTYRMFVLSLGAGNFDSAEFYGVIDDNFEDSCVPDAVWCTLSERQAIGLPKNLVIVGSTGFGDFYCVDTNVDAEGSVILYRSHLRSDEQRQEKVADDFGKFFLAQIQELI